MASCVFSGCSFSIVANVSSTCQIDVLVAAWVGLLCPQQIAGHAAYPPTRLGANKIGGAGAELGEAGQMPDSWRVTFAPQTGPEVKG